MIKIRPLPESAIRRFGQFLSSHDWSEVLEPANVNEKVVAFHNTISTKLDEIFPVKNIALKNNLDKTWMTPELKNLHRKMQREFWKNRKSAKWRQLYLQFKKLKKKNCRQFYDKFVTELKETNPSKWYTMAKQIGAVSSQTNELHVASLMDMSNQEAAEAIADHYATISQSYLPLCSADLPAILPSPEPTPNIEEHQVYTGLLELKKTKSTFPGDLPYKLRKEFAVQLSLPLQNIYNASLNQSIYPDLWKQEEVTPVPKVTSPATIKDIRKISGTSEYSKLFEGYLKNWILEDIGPNIDIAQFGNQTGTGTVHMLINLIDRILRHLESGTQGDPKAVVATFLDWAAAFDRQCPLIAISKFIHMNLRPCLVPLLASYLQNRKMIVKFRDAKSSKRDMPGGGPQGTLLGVIEYLVSSNDSTDCVDPLDRFKYVDDATVLEMIQLAGLLTEYNFRNHVANDIPIDSLYLPSQNFQSQSYISTICQWTDENQMLLNGSKSNYMIFNRTKNYQFATRLNLNGKKLESVQEVKLVGVWITSNLSWAKNTSEICRRAYARLSMITKLKYVGVSIEELLIIYVLFVRSLLEDCCVVWHSTLTKEQEDDIEQVQRVCLRVILQDSWCGYDAALEMTSLETLTDRREAHCLQFAGKCLKHKKHKSLFPLNNPNATIPKNGHPLDLRYTEKYTVNHAKTERYRQSTIPYMQRMLNKLDYEEFMKK